MNHAKVAIVTAASRGMGASIAHELATKGYQLALLSSTDAVETLAHELGAISIIGSVSDASVLQSLVERTMSVYGRVDVVVNNTGHPPKGDLLTIPDEDWHSALDLVLMNVVRMARLVTPIMETQNGGAFVNISTFAAFEPDLAFPVSGSLRAALASFTKLYSDRYASANIRMNNVLPGFIDSYPASDANTQRIPMGRYGTTTEIAKTVAFLVSDDASYITGQNIRVDGGITRSV